MLIVQKVPVLVELTKACIEGVQTVFYNDINFQEVQIPVLNISKTSLKIVAKTEFAELLDTMEPVVNFEKKIRDPAVKYDFELDTFQKLVSFLCFSCSV